MEHILENTGEKYNNEVKEVFETERKRLFNFIRSKISSVEDAEDILQGVFFQFVSSMRLEPIEKAASWLFRASSNKIIDWYRKIKPQRMEEMNFSDDEGSFLKFEDTLEAEFNSDDSLRRSVFWDMLEEALNELPEEQRDAFIMNEIDGMSFREISEITGEAVKTLISRKRYAVLFLRERFRELYDDLLENKK